MIPEAASATASLSERGASELSDAAQFKDTTVWPASSVTTRVCPACPSSITERLGAVSLAAAEPEPWHGLGAKRIPQDAARPEERTERSSARWEGASQTH